MLLFTDRYLSWWRANIQCSHTFHSERSCLLQQGWLEVFLHDLGWWSSWEILGERTPISVLNERIPAKRFPRYHENDTKEWPEIHRADCFMQMAKSNILTPAVGAAAWDEPRKWCDAWDCSLNMLEKFDRITRCKDMLGNLLFNPVQINAHRDWVTHLNDFFFVFTRNGHHKLLSTSQVAVKMEKSLQCSYTQQFFTEHIHFFLGLLSSVHTARTLMFQRSVLSVLSKPIRLILDVRSVRGEGLWCCGIQPLNAAQSLFGTTVHNFFIGSVERVGSAHERIAMIFSVKN